MESSDTLTDYDETVLADNPVAYFRLDGNNVKDLSPRNHDGRYVGAPTTTKLPNGEAATVFDGSSQYAQVSDANDISITATGKLTLEAWMRPDVLEFPNDEGSGYVHWMGKGGVGQQEYASRMYSRTNDEGRPNRISGYAFNLSGGEGIGSYFQDPVAAGEWIHYVLVINTARSPRYPRGYTKIYKNGSQRDQDSLQSESLSIVPGNGTAPFRIGTRDLRSLFKGAIGKVAIYGHELSGLDVLEHYQKLVRPLVGNVGHASSQAAGTALVIPVDRAIPAGRTLITRVLHNYTSGAPTMSDSKGNTYTRDRTASSAGNIMRASFFSSRITTALQPDDAVTVTLPSSVTTKLAVADEFADVLTNAGYLDAHNGRSGNSTTPSVSVTTTNAKDVLIGFVGVNGPADEVYSEDALNQWTTLTRIGSDSGVGDKTIHGAYRSVHSTGEYRYSPTLGARANWIGFMVAYKANTAPTI